jgi:hypothetical protein
MKPPGTTTVLFIDSSGAFVQPDANGYYEIADMITAGHLLVKGWGTAVCAAGPNNFMRPSAASAAGPWAVQQQCAGLVFPHGVGNYFTITEPYSARALLQAGWATRPC